MLPWFLCAALALIALALLAKLLLMRGDLRSLARDLGELLSHDTNALLSSPCRDRAVLRLASALNVHLRSLRALRQRYLSGDRELRDAVANVSHDLRTPLTAIRGFLELMEREDMSDAARSYVKTIRSRSDAMAALTGELFSYSYIMSTDTPVPAEPISVSAVLEECLASFYAELMSRGIELEVRMPVSPVARRVDGAALSRVFSNLLSNAVRYSAGDLRVELAGSGAVTFSNSAPGMTQVQAGRLFDRFYTVDTARGSTGLGLSIARELCRRMGADISAACERGRLEITVTLPDV